MVAELVVIVVEFALLHFYAVLQGSVFEIKSELALLGALHTNRILSAVLLKGLQVYMHLLILEFVLIVLELVFFFDLVEVAGVHFVGSAADIGAHGDGGAGRGLVEVRNFAGLGERHPLTDLLRPW